ncbi:hypothetical protein ACS0TY_005058 [Phlomoides rotata]
MASYYHPRTTIISMIFLTLTAAAAAVENSASTSPAASFHQVLQSNDLPIGLFPKDISEFSVDPTSGRFELHLLSPSPCEAKFETPVKYEWNITGSISSGKIANLSGVAAQELFLWLPVKNIQVDIPSSGLIYFDVGVVFKQFSLSFFETPKDCNALKGDDGGDDAVLYMDDHLHENGSEKLVIEEFKDEEGRADS